jgi:hypothetical protein
MFITYSIDGQVQRGKEGKVGAIELTGRRVQDWINKSSRKDKGNI